MAPPNKIPRSMLAALVASLGLGGVAPAQEPGPGAPPASIPAAPASPGAPAAAPTSAPAPDPDAPPSFLLLTNGKVLQGEIQKTASGFVLKHKIGVSLFPRAQVERVFRSLDEVFAYKKSLCPENDPDERMKLAMWCLEQKDPKYKDEARSQLGAVLELSPENRRARAMLGNLDRPQSPPRDEQVGRAGAEVDASAPAEMHLDRLREEFTRNPRSAGMPVIFDLETPQAVRRYGEFSSSIHPILQRRCARCHNETTPNDFPLIQARTRRDYANDLIVRANLEATLRLIHRDDLARSPLLTAAGMTHGNGGKPVLGGPNTPEYRALAAWATSLKPLSAGPATASAARPAPAMHPGEAFASGRANAAPDPAMPPRPEAPSEAYGTPGVPLSNHPAIPGANLVDPRLGAASTPHERVRGTPAGSLLPGSAEGLPNSPPPDSAFETPPLRMNPPPRMNPPVAKAPANPKAAPPAEAGVPKPGPNGELPPGWMLLPDTGEVVRVMTKDDVVKAKDAPDKAKKFDPKALESFMKARPKGKP